MPENTWNVVTDSLDLLRNAAALISDANREAPSTCSEWTVTQVLQHALGDQLALGGGDRCRDQDRPRTPSRLLAQRIEGSIDELTKLALDTATTACARVRCDDDAVPTPLPQGALPAATAAAACALDAAVHAWDIAVALGQPGPLSQEARRCSCFPRPAPLWSPCASSAPTHPLSRHSQQTTTRPNFCATSAETPSGPAASRRPRGRRRGQPPPGRRAPPR